MEGDLAPQADVLLNPARLWTRAEVLVRPCPVPREPGVYAWYTLELTERLKQARCEANAQAKERRKSDPKEIARKAKLKADRQEANRLAKEQRKARAQSTMKAERASKDEKLRAGIASANALGQPRSSDDP